MLVIKNILTKEKIEVCIRCHNKNETKVILNDCSHPVCYPCAKSIFDCNEKVKFCPYLTCTKKFNTATLNQLYQENFELTERLCSLCMRSPENCGTLYINENCGHRYCFECIMEDPSNVKCRVMNCNGFCDRKDLKIFLDIFMLKNN